MGELLLICFINHLGALTVKPFYIHLPGFAYSMTAYGHNRRDAIARFRTQHGYARMPKGFSVWEAK